MVLGTFSDGLAAENHPATDSFNDLLEAVRERLHVRLILILLIPPYIVPAEPHPFL